MMDFFEALEERTVDVMHSEAWATRYRKEVREYGADKSDVLVHLTIEATIEALKEMMVGQYRGRLAGIDVCESGPVQSSAHIKFDGEQVVVMVFRDDKEKD